MKRNETGFGVCHPEEIINMNLYLSPEVGTFMGYNYKKKKMKKQKCLCAKCILAFP